MVDDQGRFLFIPCHTNGHIALHFPNEKAVFTGDTLFIAGCGRLFEGTAADMHNNMVKLTALPDDTRVYCGHEYTVKNLQFALTLEPNNAKVQAEIAVGAGYAGKAAAHHSFPRCRGEGAQSIRPCP